RSVTPELLGQVDAHAEGFDSIEAFQRCWKQIYGTFDGRTPVWAITFELVEEGGERKLAMGGREMTPPSAADATNPYPPGTFEAQAWEMRRAFAHLAAVTRRQIKEDIARMKAAVRRLATPRKHDKEADKA